MKEPLVTLPFKSLSYSHQANAWPKILLLVSLPLQRLLLHADGGRGCQVSGGDHSPRSRREVPPVRSVWSQRCLGAQLRGLQCQRSSCHGTVCTSPCWLSSVVLRCSTELGLISAHSLQPWSKLSPESAPSPPSAAQQRKAEHFHPTKASLTLHR